MEEKKENDMNFIINLKNEIELDIQKLVYRLDTNGLIKFILVMFENELFNQEYEKNQANLFYKEDISEELSYVLYLKLNHFNKKLNLLKIENIDYIKFVKKNNEILNQLLELLKARSIIREMDIYITKQGYTLSIVNNVISVEHPIKNFQHYYQMGYLRNTLENITIGFNVYDEKEIKFENMSESFNEHLFKLTKIIDYEIKYHRSVKEAIIFRINPQGLAKLHRILTDEHDMRYNQIMSKYLDNIGMNINDKCTKKGNLKWIDLVFFSIVLQYLVTYMNKIIDEKSTSERMKINSKVHLMSNSYKGDFFYTILHDINSEITQKDVQAFLSKFSTNIEKVSGRIDLQFMPIVKAKEFSFILFNTFSMVDLARAYIKNFDIALDDQGKKFENVVLKVLSKHFDNIHSSIKYKDNDNKEGEIDICIIGDKNIYFIECKNNLHPISASTASTNYKNFLKSTEQVEQSENYFNMDRKGFLKKHLKIEIDNIEEYVVHKVVIMSNRNISGLNYKGISFRDIYSLDKLLDDGVLKEYTRVPGESKKLEKKIYMYKNRTDFNEIDFLNYLSEKSIYFEVLNGLAKKIYNEAKYKQYILRESMYAFDLIEPRN
ncbi:nuclease-related domain-containing protein [Nitratifractor salsuginis]|uniref:NERD domain protein n=1 Tax=Nitratifractor salsuginis (strain DSM 16511 / JCM 12458 / E9I37-1) TaxID=749222 RepID=E6X2A3_NITSE|nr:nuclease-related domain-containing protein [Nitratifractor salsuginis]ADV46038.1 NERD domain protein [Nitratifractor salsuginis DSM 16511]